MAKEWVVEELIEPPDDAPAPRAQAPQTGWVVEELVEPAENPLPPSGHGPIGKRPQKPIPEVTVTGTRPGPEPTWGETLSEIPTQIGAQGAMRVAGVQEDVGDALYLDARKRLWQSIVLPHAVRDAQAQGIPLTEHPDVIEQSRRLGIRPDVFARDWPRYANLTDDENVAEQRSAIAQIASSARMRERGAALRQQASQVAQLYRPEFSSDWSAKALVFDAAVSIPDLLVAAGADTAGGPLAGGAALAGLTAPSYYAEAKELGLDPQRAQAYSALMSLAEVVPEMPVLDVLTSNQVVRKSLRDSVAKMASRATGKVATGAVTEAISESVTEALQLGIEQGLLDQSTPLPEALERIARAGAVGAVMGGGVGGAIGAGEVAGAALDSDARAVRTLARDLDRTRAQLASPPMQEVAPPTVQAPATDGLVSQAPVETRPPAAEPPQESGTWQVDEIVEPAETAGQSAPETSELNQLSADYADLLQQPRITDVTSTTGPGERQGAEAAPPPTKEAAPLPQGAAGATPQPAETRPPSEAEEGRAGIDEAAHEAATSPQNDLPEPTDAQKEAGNYKKGHVRLHGLDISIESPAGSIRRSKPDAKEPWEVVMPHHYGYIRRTTGADGEHVDVTLGPNPEDEDAAVYVIDQNRPGTAKFDEHKVFMGFGSEQEALTAYRNSFAGDFGKKMVKGAKVTTFTLPEFKQWLAEADLTKRAAEWKSAARAPSGFAKGQRVRSRLKGWDAPGTIDEIVRKGDRDVAIVKWDNHDRPLAFELKDLAPLADSAAAAGEHRAPARKPPSAKGPDPTVDSVLEFLAKAGGVSITEAESEGLDPADLKSHIVGIRRAFHRNGMTLESAGERLAQAGYPVMEHGRVDKNKLLDLIDAELRGQKRYSVHGATSEFERELAEREAEEAAARQQFKEADELVEREKQNLETAAAWAEYVAFLELEAETEAEYDRIAATEVEERPAPAEGKGVARPDQAGVREVTATRQEAARPQASGEGAREELILSVQQAPPARAPAAAPRQELDLFGPAPVAQQAIADAQRAKDAKRNTGQESVETGDPTDLFSQARQQTDIEDTAQRQPERALSTAEAKQKAFTAEERAAAIPELKKLMGKFLHLEPLLDDIWLEVRYIVQSKRGVQQLQALRWEAGRPDRGPSVARNGARFNELLDPDEFGVRNGQLMHANIWGEVSPVRVLDAKEFKARFPSPRPKSRKEQATPAPSSEWRDRVAAVFANAMNGLTENEVLRRLGITDGKSNLQEGFTDADREAASAVLWDENGDYSTEYVKGRGIVFEPKKKPRGNPAKRAQQPEEVEKVQPGEKGTERQRKDKAVKKYLLEKRPPVTDIERVVSYRTEAVVGLNEARSNGAPADVIRQLRTEYEWAVETLEEEMPEIAWREGLQRRTEFKRGDRVHAKGHGDDVGEILRFVRPEGRLRALVRWPGDNEHPMGYEQFADVEELRKAGEAPRKRKPRPTKPAVSQNTVFTEDAAAKARELLRKKLGQINAGIDPEIMQAGITLAGYHIERGARTFAAYAKAMLEDLGEVVRPYLKSWYMGVKYDPRAAGFDGMSSAAEVEAASVEGDFGAEHSSSNLESDRARVGDDERVGREVFQPEPGGADRGDAEPRRRARSAGDRSGRRQPVSGAGAASGREGRDLGVRGPGPERPELSPGSDFREGSLADRQPGSTSEHIPAETVERTARSPVDLEAKRRKQRAAEIYKVKHGDLANIRETLPFLNEGQQNDVHFAETRFAKPDGYGVLFTNGTGTGKTYTGLGIAKRFARQGKNNILIVAPNDKIIEDWIRSGKNLFLDITKLEDTKSAGKGLVATTYANFGQNMELARREWDLIVTDESHYLGSNANGDLTDAGQKLRAIALHPDGAYLRAEMLHGDKLEAMNSAAQAARLARMSDDQRDWADIGALEEKERAATQAWKDALNEVKADVAARQGEKRPRVVFLSATPFAYRKSIEYAEGFLFEYPKDDGSGGYNKPTGRNAFFVQHFGYRMRYNKLTEPDANVNTAVMEVAFNGWLKDQGVLSSRLLDVDADYERKFVLVSDAIGTKIDEGIKFLSDAHGGKYAPLSGMLNDTFTYHNRMYLLEAIKAKAFVPIIKAELAAGRKVVVFHDFNKGGAFHPFRFPQDMQGEHTYKDETGEKHTISFKQMVADFNAERPDLVNLDFDAASPLETMAREFPNALFFNGTIPKAERIANVDKFNSDDGQYNLIVVQNDAGREGISLHDTTGKYRRTLVNLGMPVRPTAAIQQEGRIRRTGSVSDALYLYGNTGTSFERWTFATKIAERASTAENLAMGEEARALKEAFIDAFENSAEGHTPSERDGRGGKEADRARRQQLSEFEKAKSYYFGQLKKTSRTKAADGTDYFATPEPLAFKMVEWAGIRAGEHVLEPSAGHGAIARFFPQNAHRTIVEPSFELASRAALVSDARLINDTFENLHVGANKFDVIVMNPPFGVGGKTAIEHLDKAAKHLRDGGRIVAIIPTGPAADKRFEQWLYGRDEEDGVKGVYLTANILLPNVTFERAGTSVAARVVVLDKVSNPALAPQQVSRSYTDADTITEFFDAIENATVPDRPVIQRAAAREAPAQADPTRAPARAAAPQVLEAAQTKHSKTGEDLFVARITRRVDDATYQSLKAKAKAEGGWYSSYRRDGAIPGFQFKSKEARDRFIAAASEPEDITDTPALSLREIPREIPREMPDELRPPLRPTGQPLTDVAHRAPGERWNTDPGTIPGEPTYFLDGEGIDDAALAIAEVPLEGTSNVVFEVLTPEGRSLGRWDTLDAAARAAEWVADNDLTDSPAFSLRDERPVRPEEAYVPYSLSQVQMYRDYPAAKAGDSEAAARLAAIVVTDKVVDEVRRRLGAERPIVVPVLSIEASGPNQIPAAVARALAERLGLEMTTDIVQATATHRTDLGALERLFAVPQFDGAVQPGRTYLLVDDVLTQGGTFAALASHIEQNGGRVIDAFALSGKQYSRRLAPTAESLRELRAKYGDIEDQFRAATGYGFDALTESEVRALIKYSPPQSVRDRIAEAARTADSRRSRSRPEAPTSGEVGPALSLHGRRGYEIRIEEGGEVVKSRTFATEAKANAYADKMNRDGDREYDIIKRLPDGRQFIAYDDNGLLWERIESTPEAREEMERLARQAANSNTVDNLTDAANDPSFDILPGRPARTPVPVDVLRAHIVTIAGSLPDADIRVVTGINGIEDGPQKAAMIRRGYRDNEWGGAVVKRRNGTYTLYLNATAIDSLADAERTLWHEATHRGFYGVLGGKAYGQLLEHLFTALGGKPTFEREIRLYFDENHPFDIDEPLHRQRVVDEFLARWSERVNAPDFAAMARRVVNAIKAWIDRFLRERGWRKTISKAEIEDTLRRMARHGLRHGAPTNVGQERVVSMAQWAARQNARAATSGSTDGTPALSLFDRFRGRPPAEGLTVRANVKRLLALLGPNLYSAHKIGETAIKELFQNSFDAVKAQLAANPDMRGRIDIDVGYSGDTITITDNGVGMTPEIVRDALFTIAGTNKKGAQDPSGGFGIAKAAFLLANEEFELETTRDGITTKVRTTGKQIAESIDDPSVTIPMRSEYTGKPPGTRIRVKMPEYLEDPSTGEKQLLYVPTYAPDVLRDSPLLRDIEVRYRAMGKEEVLPIGANFPAQDYTRLKDIQFSWGRAVVYMSRNDVPLRPFANNLHYLSNGLLQFSRQLKRDPFNFQEPPIPRQFYVDLRITVPPEDARYPFQLNRQGFKTDLSGDFLALEHYLASLADVRELGSISERFGEMRYLDGNGQRVDLRPQNPPADELQVSASDTVSVRNGELIVNGKKVPVQSRADLMRAGVQASAYRARQDSIDGRRPILHDGLQVGRADSSTEPFAQWFTRKHPEFPAVMRELATAFMELRDVVGKAFFEPQVWQHDGVPLPVGVSLAKGEGQSGYLGITTKVPITALFLNPARIPGKSARAKAQSLYVTMTHELVHLRHWNHDTDFAYLHARVLSELPDHMDVDAFVGRLVRLIEQNRQLFEDLDEDAHASRTTVLGKPLEGSARTDEDGRGGEPGDTSIARARSPERGAGADRRGPADGTGSTGPAERAGAAPGAKPGLAPRTVASSTLHALPIPQFYRAYQRMAQSWIDVWNEKIGWRYGPLGKLPDQKTYLKERYLTLGRIGNAENIAREIYNTFVKADPQDAQAIYDYLTTAGANPDGIRDVELRRKARVVKGMIDRVGRALVTAGLLSKQAYEAHADAYLPRVYLRHMLGDEAMRAFGQGKRPSDMGYLKERKDIPKEVRELILGEILDPAFLASFSLSRTLRDLAIIGFLNTISQHKDWVLKGQLVQFNGRKVTPQWLKAEAAHIRNQAKFYAPDVAARARQVADQMEQAANAVLNQLAPDLKQFRQVPDSVRYGMLRGMWVRKEIFDDLIGAQQFLDPNNAGWAEKFLGQGGLATKATQWWKLSKVALNPPSQIRNFISNQVLLHLSGVPFSRVYSGELLVRAIREIKNNGRFAQVARRYGLFATTFSNIELARIEREWLDLQARRAGTASPAHLKAIGAAIVDAASDAYGLAEAITKIAKIIDAIEREGMSESDAVLEAQRWLFDYSLVPKSVQFLRNAPVGVPFLTFAYKVLPRMLEVAVKHPVRLTMYAALPWVVAGMIADDEDVDREDVEKLKRALPEWLREKSGVMLLPYRDSLGRWQAFNFGYYLPWTTFTDVAKKLQVGKIREALDVAGIPGGPLVDVVSAISTNVDPFTKREIVNPNDPPGEQIAQLFGFLYNLAAPPFLGTEGDLAKIKRAALEEAHPRTGEPGQTLLQAAMRMLGMGIYPIDPEQSRAANLRQMNFELQELERRMSERARDRSLTPKQREDVIRTYRKLIEEKNEQIRLYEQESRVHPNLRREGS